QAKPPSRQSIHVLERDPVARRTGIEIGGRAEGEQREPGAASQQEQCGAKYCDSGPGAPCALSPALRSSRAQAQQHAEGCPRRSEDSRSAERKKRRALDTEARGQRICLGNSRGNDRRGERSQQAKDAPKEQTRLDAVTARQQNKARHSEQIHWCP